MRLAFDISPVNNSSNVRGIGTYAQNLLELLKKTKEDLEVETFSGKKIPPVDIVHYPYFDFFFHTLPIIKKKPRVVTIHDVIPLIFPQHYPPGMKGKVNFYLQNLALKNVDAIICDSQSAKNDIQTKLGYPKNKIFPIYLAASNEFKIISKETAKKISAPYKLPEDFFVYVGDVNWNKNISGLLRAIKELGVNLVMVGKSLTDENLSQTKEIDEQISTLGIEQKIFKTGYVSNTELCAIYNLAKATVVPSYYEGFGLPVVESMTCGTPVICSERSSVPEIAGDMSIYFNPQSGKSILEAFEKFSTMSESQLKKMKLASIAQSKNFSWDKTASETIKVYRQILK